MKKKLIFILILLFGLFFGKSEVNAEVDHTFNYEIRTFDLSDDNKLTIEGWGFIHNYDNYGGMTKDSFDYVGGGVERQGSSAVKKNDAKLRIYFYFFDGSRKIGFNSDGTPKYTVTFVSKDMTTLMCYEDSTGLCYSDSNVYYNVGFKIVIDLNEIIASISSNNKLSLRICAELANGKSADENLAVLKGVANNKATDLFKMDDLSTKVDITGNHVVFPVSSVGSYWKLTSNSDDFYYVRSISKGSSYSTYYLYYGNSLRYSDFLGNFTYKGLSYKDIPKITGLVAGTDSSDENTYITRCGWRFVRSLDSSMNVHFDQTYDYTRRKCVQPSSNASGSYSGIKSYFVKAIGSVKIVYKGDPVCADDDPTCYPPDDDVILTDKVCDVSSRTLNSCSSGIFNYSCNEMKIMTEYEDTVLSAIVFINEKGEFRSADYTNTFVTSGRSFDLDFKYIYSLAWRFKDIECNDVDESTCKSKLYGILSGNNYFGNATASVLADRLNSDGIVQADGYTFANGTDANLESAGAWTCESNSGLDSGDLTIMCNYKVNDAYINYYTNYITYSDMVGTNNNYKNLGSHFYLPLSYSKSNFKWNISTGNLSLINVRTTKNNYSSTTPNSWRIDTSGNSSNKCSVQVTDNPIVPNDPDGTTNSELIYRSVDVNVEENELDLYYITTDTNWYKYFYNNSNTLNSSRLARINNTFEHLHYITNVLTKTKIKSLLNSYDEADYTSWNKIASPSGQSPLISDSNYFEIKGSRSGIHCSWGEFKNSCDKYG